MGAASAELQARIAEAARQAADRGAKLTSQLLAFSRRQKLDPQVVNTDRLIRDFQVLIRRAVGEACEVNVTTDEELWPCHIDPAQMVTALLNLALNGRDAMPDGGVLTMEARNIILDEEALAGLPSGPYVRLAVIDTGCGMPPDEKRRHALTLRFLTETSACHADRRRNPSPIHTSKLTQAELASRIGCSLPTVGQAERGEGRVDTFERLAAALDMEVAGAFPAARR